MTQRESGREMPQEATSPQAAAPKANARRRLLYVCLQTSREGQASHAHVHEIIRGLERLGWAIELFEPPHRTGSSLLARVGAFAALQFRVLRRLPSADAVYIRAHMATTPIALAARLMRVPSVQEVNGPFQDYYISYPFLKRLRWVVNGMARAGLRLAKSVIAVTPQLADWVRRESGARSVHVVANAANSDLFTPEATAGQELPARRVVFVGAMAPWHGVREMLAAVKHPAWPADVHLVLAGQGVESDAVEAAAADSDRIAYLGKLPYREVPGVVAGSLAGMVAISDPQGRSATGLFPIKLFETLACGVPAIVTDYPGQADLVERHRCGLVTPPGDSAALARAVAKLAADERLRAEMSERARRAIVEQHSWAHRAADTDRILRSAVQRRAA